MLHPSRAGFHDGIGAVVRPLLPLLTRPERRAVENLEHKGDVAVCRECDHVHKRKIGFAL